MASEDSQSVNRALLDDDSEGTNRHARVNPPSSCTSSNKPNKVSVKSLIRNNISSASLRRYRSPFHRNSLNTSSLNTSSYQPAPSFPLFRHAYLMRNSFKHRRPRPLHRNSVNVSAMASEKSHSAPRLENRHILVTILLTVVSVALLVGMIVLDLVYLTDAFPRISDGRLLAAKQGLCTVYPKLCLMKGLVIIVFTSIAVILCYSVLTLYTRAKRHSRLLERKTQELEKEKCLTQKLLHQILPPCVAKELINGRKAPAEYFDSVTVYFSDIVGFTAIASMCSANETCDMLNQLYSIFDSLLENFDVYKVETIGDAYMVVSGAPTKNGEKHPNEIADMSLALLCGKQHVRVPRTFAELQLRIGIHTGPVCAAVIGSKMPRYCMFGDTVNVANRMESSGLPERVHLSDDTYQRLLNREQYIFEERGEIGIKGKGLMQTYFLLGRRGGQINGNSHTNLLIKQE